MAETFPVTEAFMLVDGDREAMEFQYEPGTRNPSLATGPTGGTYIEGDLVAFNATYVAKPVTAATAPSGKQLYLAGQDYEQPFAMKYLTDRGVPLNVIPSRNQFVFTLRGANANATHVFTQGNKNSIMARATCDLAATSNGEIVALIGTDTNHDITLLGIFKGDVGDTDVQVIARINSIAGA